MKSSLSRSAEELRERTSAAFGRLGLVPGSSLTDVLEVVANVTGRRIEIDPIGGREWETVTGLVVLREGEARVLVRKSDPRWYQFHSVLHELSHLVLDHTGCSSLPSGRRAGIATRPGQTILARSTLQLDFEAGIDFDDPEAVREAEAEKLSQLLAQVMLGPKHPEDEAALG
jgi:hypothetical protein